MSFVLMSYIIIRFAKLLLVIIYSWKY